MGKIKIFLLYLLAVFFVLAGVNHFRNPAFYLKMMPPYLPAHGFLVALSGVCEIGLGVLVLWPKYRRWAAWGLIALLIAVFPANFYMAFNPHLFPDVSQIALWARLPFQAVFIAWAYWYAKPNRLEYKL